MTTAPTDRQDTTRYAVDCPVCHGFGDPVTEATAEQLAGLHDELNHRGQPTATITPVTDGGHH